MSKNTMNNKSERDSHFSETAKLLMYDLHVLMLEHHKVPIGEMVTPAFFPALHRMLTQRVYDLMYHAGRDLFLERDIAVGFIQDVPDLTAWPEPLP